MLKFVKLIYSYFSENWCNCFAYSHLQARVVAKFLLQFRKPIQFGVVPNKLILNFYIIPFMQISDFI